MAEKDLTSTKTSGGGKLLAGTNLLIYTVVGVAIVVLANWFVGRHDKRWDLTPNQKYSLAPQSLKLLKGLNQEVNIWVFDRERSRREHGDVLGNYSAASPRVHVQYVDPDRQPMLARQFGIRTFGTIVVASGDRHYEAQGDTEEGVTNALIRVLKGQSVACFIQGHQEGNLDSTDARGYDRVKKALESENYRTETPTLLQKNEIPSDCSLVIVAGPKHDYEQPEVETLRKYVSDGGRAMFMLDAGFDLPNLSKLLADWNVSVRRDLVIDVNPVAQVFGTKPYMPLILNYGSSPIVKPLERSASLFPLTRSLEIGKETKANVTTESLCQTSSDSYGVADFDSKSQAVGAYRPGKDFKGPLTVAVSATLTGQGTGAADKKPEGRFVTLGTSLIAANSYLGFQANRDLFMNMINWLSANEDLMSIRPKPPESQHLNLTEQQMRRVLVLGVIGLPVLIIVAGVSVWWSRR